MVKKIVQYTLLLFFAWGIVFSTNAQSPQQLFDKANQKYQKQAYDSALAVYAQMIHAGYLNKELFFNAGNASYKSGKAGYAIYYYTKALQKDPGNKAYIHNLHLAQIKAFNKTKPITGIFLVRWWHNFLHFFSINTWLILSIVFFWILLFLIGWTILSIQPPKIIRRLRVPIAVIFCCCFLGAIFSLQSFKTHDSAIIVTSDSLLKGAPDQNSTSLEHLQEGIQVKLLNSVNRWKKIKLTDGKEGWINKKNIAIL